MPDRDKLIAALGCTGDECEKCPYFVRYSDEFGTWGKCDEEKIHSDAIELLREQEPDIAEDAPTVGGWISVQDRLPGNEFVLVSAVSNATGHRWKVPTVGELVHRKWFIETEGTTADNVGIAVTHWMPLPDTEGLDKT